MSARQVSGAHDLLDLIALIAEHLDEAHYRAQNPGMSFAGLSPAEHYHLEGWRLGRDPRPDFSTTGYLALHRDIAHAGIDPFLHWLQAGRREGRIAPRPGEDPERSWFATVRQRTDFLAALEGSGLFDPVWYVARHPEAAQHPGGPFGHFGDIGLAALHDPCALFSAAFYLASYPDIGAAKMNPLLHYLFHGGAEKRQPHPFVAPRWLAERVDARQAPRQNLLAAYAAVRGPVPPRPIFDLKTLAPALGLAGDASGWDILRAFVLRPLAGRPAPHPAFDAGHVARQLGGSADPLAGYLERQGDGIDPHPRLPAARLADGAQGGRGELSLLEQFLEAGGFLPEEPAPGPAPRAAAAPADAPGKPEARPPVPGGAEGTGTPPFPILAPPADLRGLEIAVDRMPPAAEAAVEIRAGRETVVALAEPATLDMWRAPLLAFARLSGAPAFEGVEDRPASLRPVPLTQGWEIGDLWFAHGARLVLSLRGAGAAILSAYQVDRETTCVGRALLPDEGPAFVDADLANPFLPVLLVLSEPDGLTREVGLIAFPSLARGGLHHAELIAAGGAGTSTQTLWTYAAARAGERSPTTLAVRLAGATGAEPIFSREMRAWLALFGVSLAALAGTEAERDALAAVDLPEGDAASARLVLPPDAIPTIATVTGAALDRRAGEDTCIAPYLVADATTGRPLWGVTLPPDPALVALQAADLPLLRGVGPGGPAIATCIRLRDPDRESVPQTLLPRAPARGPVLSGSGRPLTCILTATEPERTARCLAALAAQEGEAPRVLLHLRDPRLRAAMAAALARHPAGGEITDRDPRDVAWLLAAGTDLLILSDDAMLYDPRTLDTLRALAEAPRTASAAAVTLQEIPQRRSSLVHQECGGYFPTQINLIGAPSVVLSAPDVASALPQATYPVMANDLAATLVSRAALAAAGVGRLDPVGFGLAALLAGYRHLATSAVRVGTVARLAHREVTDPLAPARIAPARWVELLGQVTMLRELA